MLKERQIKIMNDLERTNEPVSAFELSQRYHVSLRTIRNDIDKIAAVIKGTDAVFIRIPGVGLRIKSDNKIELQIFKDVIKDEYINYSFEERIYILVFLFTIQNEYLSAEFIAHIFDISKTTINNEIKKANNCINQFHLRIIGKRKHGFILLGSESSLFKYINQQAYLLSDNKRLFDFIFVHKWQLFFDFDRKYTDTIAESIEKNLHLVIIDRFRFFIGLNYLLSRNTKLGYLSDGEKPNYIVEMEKHINSSIHPSLYPMFSFLLVSYTDYLNNDHHEDQILSYNVDQLIVAMVKAIPLINTDYLSLKNDLLIHMRSSIDRINLGIEEKNPLLGQIKTRYYEAFNALTKSLAPFERSYDIKFNDDEIGFITLYFARSIDKYKELSEANILVLCNTGRGAAKLLSSRIMNNLPEVHILGIGSTYLLSTYEHLLDTIDLIISTVALESSVPHIVVSPLFNEREVQQVRELIYMIKRKSTPVRNEDLLENIDDLHSISTYNIGITSRVITAETYAEIAMETVSMYEELKVQSDNLNKLAGILTHVLMSVPRWNDARFISTADYNDFLERYPFQMTIAGRYMRKIEHIFNIFIPVEEVVAIVRYII